jgi:hypothetical protein
MQKTFHWLFLSAIVLLATVDCFAGQIRAYVTPFTVTGTANGDELKVTLQNLLMSRLSGDALIAVDSAESADISVKGSYVAFGSVFSLDAVAKSRDGKVLVRAFEQGERQEEMLPAVGKLAKTLLAGIDKSYKQSEAAPASGAVTPRIETMPPPKDIVRAAADSKATGSGWMSQKLAGELSGVALGRKLGTGERELFITGNNTLYYYRLAKELSLVAQIPLPQHQKILGIDTADLDGDGVPEIYLTVMSGDELASEVWLPEGNTLKRIAEKLPYYFRALTFQGKSRKIYAQQAGLDVDYFGAVYEVVKNGARFTLNNPLKLPRYANILNMNMIQTREGKSCFIVLHPDGYLLVFDDNGKELWRSSDKYGGSENFFSREDQENMRVTGAARRKIFLEQRLTVTKNGEIIVPKNEGFFVVGDSRSYTKNSVFAFVWNGLMLDELWHTKMSQNYLADYLYDDEQKELLLLEVVKKAGIIDRGASALSIKRVE